MVFHKLPSSSWCTTNHLSYINTSNLAFTLSFFLSFFLSLFLPFSLPSFLHSQFPSSLLHSFTPILTEYFFFFFSCSARARSPHQPIQSVFHPGLPQQDAETKARRGPLRTGKRAERTDSYQPLLTQEGKTA